MNEKVTALFDRSRYQNSETYTLFSFHPGWYKIIKQYFEYPNSTVTFAKNIPLMTSMKISIFLSLIYCLSAFSSFSFPDSTITPKDFKNLVGCWNGSLTYLDYSTNKSFSMPANIILKDFKKSKKIIYSLIYPKEPGANSSDTIFISEDGRSLNFAAIKTMTRFNKDSIQIITETNSIDGNDNRAAIIRHTYLLGRDTYLTRKEVQFSGETQWLLRNEYKLIRVKPCS